MRRRKRLGAMVGWRIVALAAAAFLLLGPGGWPARGQASQEAAELGGYRLKARANGLTVFYDTERLVPIGPLVEVTVPETTATLTTGPLGYSLASLGYPGPIVADFEGVVGQTGALPFPFPSYPVRTEASYPGSTTEEEDTSTVPGGRMYSLAEGPLSIAEAEYPSSGVEGLVQVGSVESRASTSAEASPAVGKARVVLSDVTLLGGLIRLDSVETDLRATSDGETVSSRGGTVVTGLRVFGRKAVIDASGVRFAEAPEGGDDAIVPPPDDPGVGEIADGADEATAPARDPLAEALSEVDGGLAELLARGGVSLELTEPHEAASGDEVVRRSTGLRVRVDYEGREEPFAQLLDLVPADQVPRIGEDPASTTAPIAALRAHHIVRFDLAAASLEVAAVPAFDAPPISGFGDGGAPEVGGEGSGAPLPGAAPASTTGDDGDRPSADRGGEAPLVLTAGGGGDGHVPGRALPAALLVALVLVSTPVFGRGAARLADSLVAGGAGGCPLEAGRPDDAE